ncbi:hypothetical protein D9757_006524 [Collybiopsis confluens]|uniref:CSN8/PSMD8/EIF3K domain-containing protein n=1 Tax=Collybiopsis confluens TaxID=2823264 RepID=A0A8H5HQC1_9AGAR|nr:hypothetical protein D9757_006524 [Collybiopsis confluens]
MANGPPTPPLTTDAEIQDELRMSDAPASTAVQESTPAAVTVTATTTTEGEPYSQPQQPRDPYQLIFPRIANNEQQLSRFPMAKLVLERLQPNIISTPLVKAVGSLTQAYSAGSYEGIYGKSEMLLNLVAQPAFPEPELAQVIRNMVESFLLYLRDRTFVLLSRAYTSISVSHAEMYFGMKADDLLPVAARHGWEYDVTSKVLKPVPAKESSSIAPAVSSLSNFHFISQSVSQLELY